VPKAGQIAALADANTSVSSHLQALQDAAREHGVGLSVYRVANI